MRKVYILRESEEDGAVLDALIAQGLSLDEAEFENPKCPRCGGDTLLAYTEDDEFQVIVWDSLSEPEEAAGAEAWYLICQRFECDYEEQVERAFEPMDTTLFDLQTSHWLFDDYSGIMSQHSEGYQKLINYFKELSEHSLNRKFGYYLEEVQWRYDENMEQVREWLRKVPMGHKVSFHVPGRHIKAAFLVATDSGCLVTTMPEGELIVVQTQSIQSWGPHDFSVKPEVECHEDTIPDAPQLIWNGDFFPISGLIEKVVVRGYHLELEWVDRFGLYQVIAREEAAGRALALEQEGEHYWKGRFRRSEIEMRYDTRDMVKVRGHWLEVWGQSRDRNKVGAMTLDPQVAAELDMRPVYEPEQGHLPEEKRAIAHWSGTFPRNQVEEESEARTYHWPIPELQASGGQE